MVAGKCCVYFFIHITHYTFANFLYASSHLREIEPPSVPVRTLRAYMYTMQSN